MNPINSTRLSINLMAYKDGLKQVNANEYKIKFKM